jgi:mono/diheme cytochrome c family protein
VANSLLSRAGGAYNARDRGQIGNSKLNVSKPSFAMKRAKKTAVLLLTVLFWTTALTMAGQSQAATKNGSAQATSPPSGESLFNTYCAVCHGKDAKGNGPAASALKPPPPNLTTLARRHGGKFPTDYVAAVLQYGVQNIKAHGSPDMPIWGEVFGPKNALRKSPSLPLAEEREADSAVAMQIHNLSQYIESLQVK